MYRWWTKYIRHLTSFKSIYFHKIIEATLVLNKNNIFFYLLFSYPNRFNTFKEKLKYIFPEYFKINIHFNRVLLEKQK